MPAKPSVPPDKPENETSLPVLRTWRAMYVCVVIVFVVWVALLTWLTLHYA